MLKFLTTIILITIITVCDVTCNTRVQIKGEIMKPPNSAVFTKIGENLNYGNKTNGAEKNDDMIDMSFVPVKNASRNIRSTGDKTSRDSSDDYRENDKSNDGTKIVKFDDFGYNSNSKDISDEIANSSFPVRRMTRNIIQIIGGQYDCVVGTCYNSTSKTCETCITCPKGQMWDTEEQKCKCPPNENWLKMLQKCVKTGRTH